MEYVEILAMHKKYRSDWDMAVMFYHSLAPLQLPVVLIRLYIYLNVSSFLIPQAREFDDPAGLYEKAECLLREWVNIYHSPASGRDSTRGFSNFVQLVGRLNF